MKKTQIEIIVPVLLPHPVEGIDELCEETINQILKLPLSIDFSQASRGKIETKEVTGKRNKSLRNKYFKFRHICNFRLLSFKTSTTFKLRGECFIPKKKLSPEEELPLRISSASTDLEFLINKVVMAANIARPGTLNTDSSISFVDSEYFASSPGLHNDISSLYIFDNKIEYPEIQFLNIVPAWKWLVKFKDFNEGFGNSSLGRSLGAFSYLFSHDINQADPTNNLWSIIGLEALYKSNGSKKELLERIKLFIGDHEKLNSIINEIYKVRSSIVHGGMNIPLMFWPFAGTDACERYFYKTNRLINNSLTILIATLQKMMLLKIYEIEFELILKKYE
jgi:hypothetical protein